MGGEKAYPLEVENVILEMDNVVTVILHDEKTPVMGNIVCAKVHISKAKNDKSFINKIKKI